MRGASLVVATGAVLVALVVSSLVGGLPPSVGTTHTSQGEAAAPASGPQALSPPSSSAAGASLVPRLSGISSAFDQRVRQTASSLAAAGVPAHSIRLPYVGSSAQVVDGAVVPGYAVAAQGNVTQDYPRAPAPVGLAYYGENDTSGAVQATTLDASSVEGTLTVNQMDALYLDVDTPDMWGIQLNAVLTDVTLHGVAGYQFWVQNAVDVYQHNDTINLGEDTWNFSAPGAYIAPDTSTILSHDP
ncbi:MAG TPA: thermopsin family protease, partial [Thermoplasmata archaeon]|nr:thermopsin family protease [Thermoplasmata archaeon]